MLVRALRIIVALLRSRFGVSLDELADEADCSRRTLYRYLDAMQEAGIRFNVSCRPSGEIVRRIEHIDGRRIGVA